MKSKLMLVLLVLSTFLLTGCFETLKKTVYLDKNVFVKADNSMLKNCNVSLAPNKVDYITSPIEQREETLYYYSKSLLNDLANCNLQWKTFREWQDKQEAIFTAQEKAKVVVPETK
jgi:hypothetical protein